MQDGRIIRDCADGVNTVAIYVQYGGWKNHKGNGGMVMKTLRRRRLNEMPFDRWDESNWRFVHATGNEILVEENDGTRHWVVEYEDDKEV